VSEDKQQQSGRRITRIVTIMLVFIVGGAAALLGFRFLLLQPFTEPSLSMFPNVVSGDYFFVSRLSFFFRAPRRGEIVVFTPEGSDVQYVKRIVGMPGDRIQMSEGTLLINGTHAPRQLETVDQALQPPAGGSFYREVLPNGATYVVFEESEEGPGDDTPEIAVPAGHYFMLGDNRDNSVDSRFPEVMSYIPSANLLGPVVFRRWNSEGVPLSVRPAETAGKD